MSLFWQLIEQLNTVPSLHMSFFRDRGYAFSHSKLDMLRLAESKWIPMR
jgi:hypothetical protein